MSNIPKPKNQIIRISVAKDDLIKFLKESYWAQGNNGREYLRLVGFINAIVDQDGYNVFLYEAQRQDQYGTPRRLMMRGNSQEVYKERKRQWDEFKEQNPEIYKEGK